MRPLTSSLTKEQLAERLDLTAELVDALLDSGRVLCHVTRGEVRVPLAQVEAFLRDALIRVYQADAAGAATEPIAVSAAAVAETTTHSPQLTTHNTPPPDESNGPSEQNQPAGLTTHSSPPADDATDGAPEPAPPQHTAHPPAARPIPPPPAPPEEADRPEQRIASRYVPLRQLSGIFGDIKFSVLQLSATGLRIRHSDPLMPGDEAKLSFALLKSARSVVVRARVVWTSIAKSGEDRFSISGLRIIDHADRLEQAIELMKAAHELQPERRAKTRRLGDGLTMIGGISDEEMALVTGAVRKFADDPVEASRWYSRARFALADETVRRLAPERPREREEVLGIWEYLERRVDIVKIAGVMSWMRPN